MDIPAFDDSVDQDIHLTPITPTERPDLYPGAAEREEAYTRYEAHQEWLERATTKSARHELQKRWDAEDNGA